MFKCAMLGCGGRARGHADAYRYVKRGKLAAICDLNETLLNRFGDAFNIDARYTDLHEMLDKEKPDLLHIVTSPVGRETQKRLRVPLMRVASAHHVPAVIVEKPIAVDGEDWRELTQLSETTTTKFVVNTQLHFHPKNLELKRDVTAGKIGDVRLIEASARLTLSGQGPHVLQLVSSYIDNAPPVKVFGQVSGKQSLDSDHPAPDHAVASITYQNGVRASVMFGTEAGPKISHHDASHRHKRVAVFGTRGFVQWTMDNWERNTPMGGYESGPLDYGEQDVIAQGGLTEAVFDWLLDEKKTHPTHLKQSLIEFNLVLGIYQSGLTHAPVSLPCDPPDGIIDALKARL